jgi:predicted ThiF/HesA family dinucleotide-utilizing enzyme
MGLDDDELRRLELEILKKPKAGVVVPGTGNLRKIHFSLKNLGKRGGTRVYYVDLRKSYRFGKK